MNDKEILQKAIKIAKQVGYKYPQPDHWNFDTNKISICPIKTIFSHDFAKAFWPLAKEGERVIRTTFMNLPFKDEIKQIYTWEYHLQQMVLEENPIQYLKQFLDE